MISGSLRNKKPMLKLLLGLVCLSGTSSLHNAPVLPKRETIYYFGDPQIGFGSNGWRMDQLRFATAAQRTTNATAVVIAGDLVNVWSNATHNQAFNTVLTELFPKPDMVHLVPGNHDINSALHEASVVQRQLQNYRAVFGDDYHSFRTTYATVVLVNSEMLIAPHLGLKDTSETWVGAQAEAQWAWLERTLAAVTTPHTIVVTHHPPYLKDRDEDDVHWNWPRAVRPRFLALLKQYSVRTVLCGHTHTTTKRTVDDLTIYTVAGTARAFDEHGCGYQVLNIDGLTIKSGYVRLRGSGLAECESSSQKQEPDSSKKDAVVTRSPCTKTSSWCHCAGPCRGHSCVKWGPTIFPGSCRSCCQGKSWALQQTSRNAFEGGLLIMAGAQKAGTTQLASAVSNSFSWICGGHGENHFFDQSRLAVVPMPDKLRLRLFEEYAVKACVDQTLVRLHRSPSYMFARHAAWRMVATFKEQGVLPHVRILMVLRNPVARAVSGFYQLNAMHGHSYLQDAGVSPLAVMKSLFETEITLLNRCQHHLSLKLGCRTSEQQVGSLLRCLSEAQAASAIKGKWFRRFNTNTNSGGDMVFHEGILLRGYYADQIRNFICAGFRPDQLILATTGEVRNSLGKVLDRIANAFGKPTMQTPHIRIGKGTSNSRTAIVPPQEYADRLMDFLRPQSEDLLDLLDELGIVVDTKAFEEEMLQAPVLKNKTTPL